MSNMINNKKYSKKFFIALALKCDGATYSNFVADAQAEYAKCVKKDGEEGWVFQQFEGHLHEVLKDGKVTPTGRKWFWGIDWKQGSENYGHLYKDLGKEGKPYKVVLCSSGKWVPFDPWSIAQAVHDAVKSGKDVVPNPYESGEKPAYKPVEAKDDSFVPLPDAEVSEREDRVAMLQKAQPSKAEQDAFDRLVSGDPSIFTELGETSGHALAWSKQIRQGEVEIESLDDLTKINGIGNKIAEKLMAKWVTKFDHK